MTVVDQRGLQLAREVRKAIAEREADRELQAAIDVYDRAVTPVERQAAASYLLTHSAQADARYSCAVNVALMRLVAPELLAEEER
jgi:hypothetical protein